MIIAIAWIISILLTALVVWLTNDSAEHQRGYKSGYETGAADGRKAGYLHGELIGRKFGDAEGYERSLGVNGLETRGSHTYRRAFNCVRIHRGTP